MRPERCVEGPCDGPPTGFERPCVTFGDGPAEAAPVAPGLRLLLASCGPSYLEELDTLLILLLASWAPYMCGGGAEEFESMVLVRLSMTGSFGGGGGTGDCAGDGSG